MNIDSASLRLSAQRALLFNITVAMRYIFVELGADGRLKMLVYVHRELTEDESDFLYSAAGEICGDFVGLDYNDVDVVVDNSSYEILKTLDYLIFAIAD